MKAAWENGTFHLSQELIYILALDVCIKKKNIKSLNNLGKTAKSSAQKYSVRITFFLPFQILYTALGYTIAKFSPQNLS